VFIIFLINLYNNKFLTPLLYPGIIFIGLVRVILLFRTQKETLNKYVDKYILSSKKNLELEKSQCFEEGII
jgi:hypothetical protein